MPNTVDRRTFLTHSAATVGGVAMAGTVVDSLIAEVAGATTGVNNGTPVTGGTLNIGVTSDAPKVHTFTGQTGKLDAAGFCVAAAVYDPLFVTNAAGTAVLPYLALSAVGSNSYKTWTVTLRQGISFHAGGAFNADAVVANFQAAKADATVGQALSNVLDSCVKVSTYVVKYTTHFSYYTFPFSLAEQQIAFMADPNMFAPTPSNPNTYTWNTGPSGTGPFVYSSWNLNSTSTWNKNTTYWRKDSAGRALPYLDHLTFHVVPDAPTMLSYLQGGTVDIAVFFDGVTQKQIRTTTVTTPNGAVAYVSDLHSTARDPAMNCVMINVTGKDAAGNYGYQDTSGTWHHQSTGAPTSDIRIRKALALAISRPNYLAGVDLGQGLVSDGPFRSTSKNYVNPKYPAGVGTTGGKPSDITAAKALVNSYKAAHGNTTPVVHMQTVSGSTASADQFTFIQNAATAIGITLQSVPMIQSVLIGNAIGKTYECTAWSQFGGVTPDLNYVWWTAFKFGSKYYSGFVNFANNVDVTLENAMLAAVATSSASTRKKQWGIVNKQLATDIPYLWLDTTVSMWVADNHVQNFAQAKAPGASSVNSTTNRLAPDGGSNTWAEIWKS